MAFKPTKKQQEVIDLRNKDLLVSAAAGSGKTAVLVERILKIITDNDNPCDIDRLLIVTFTKAAASEMKERIYSAIEEKRATNPMDRNLLKQASLVHYAPISTIDSFCSTVVKEHFNEAGINPDFSVVDSGNLMLLQNEVLDELFMEKFESEDVGFISLCDKFVKKESLNSLKNIIIKLYNAADCYPWPIDWLNSLKENYYIDSIETLYEAEWYNDLLEYTRHTLSDSLKSCQAIIDFSKNNLDEMENPHPYTAIFETDYSMLKTIADTKDTKDFEDMLLNISFKTMARKRPGDDEIITEKAKKLRDELKADVNSLKDFIIKDKEEFIEQLSFLKNDACTLIDFVIEYTNRLLEQKVSENVFSFTDIEHFALNVLRDNDTKEPTDTARGLKEYYQYIMVDEYQDSNLLQEAILTAVAKEADGSRNYFMVGDVKQSIYRFRKAKPSLFIKKLNKYKSDNNEGKLISLSGNFRSLLSVTECVNDIFFEIMHSDIGGIEYDDEAKLISLAEFDAPIEPYKAEMLLCNADDPEFVNSHLNQNYIEGRMIAAKIDDIVGKLLVRDKDGLRPCRYSDIVILHRSANKVGSFYVDALCSQGIPICTSGTKGYYTSYEIESILAMLSVLNNPFDDINLVCVLKNFYSFTKDELTGIAEYRQRNEIFSFSKAFFEMAKSDEATEHIKEVCDEYENLRYSIREDRIYRIIQKIIGIGDFYSRIVMMSDGEFRKVNIGKLLDISIGFEKNGTRGLFEFVSFMEDKKSYDSDAAAGDVDSKDAVRLMTVHKSKGLEFPVCFVAGMSKQFNNSETRDDLTISDKYGAALTLRDKKNRIKINTAYTKALKHFENMEISAENQRLLYVALTRAKDKLFLTGVEKQEQLDKKLELWKDKTITASLRLKAKSFLDMALPVFIKNNYTITRYTSEDIVDATIKNIAKKTFLESNNYKEVDEEKQFEYPIKAALYLKSKYSVSEIKSKHLEMDEAENLYSENREFVKRIPSFIGSEKKVQNIGVIRGRAVHRFMECLDFTETNLEKELERMVNKGLLTIEEAGFINIFSMERFLESNLAKRMIEANKKGNLFREKTFVCSVLSRELFSDLEFSKEEWEDTTLIQGIIDAYFIEDEKVVLLDYKTDKVNNEKELAKKYKSQLLMYSDALLRATGMEIKEIMLYSFYLGKEITL